ncbi:DUF2971 domain-containing protein [Enterobacter sp. ASE]|uniref:DUF2971 domain-containing protein n=1 Tax=Enterobacter sp. ASE TaxID=2905968 RepID=UPI001E5F3D61|nr:DUF2971 domain-containing protein [Enterobacter sp. ASE]
MSIYHYTDLHGLLGIVSKSELWATNIYFLNDRLEFRHGLKCYLNALAFYRDRVTPELRGKVTEFINLMQDVSVLPFYSISFSKVGDQLSQWRGYGKENGVCIEFDEDYLHAALKDCGYYIQRGEVDYLGENNHEEIWKVIERFSPIEHLELAFTDGNRNANVHRAMLLRGLVAFIKHEGFSEEREYRFVFTSKDNAPAVNFRVTHNGYIPYVIFKAKEKLPIKSVCIGPVKEKEQIKKGIRFLLDSSGYQHVAVNFSNVPYRG